MSRLDEIINTVTANGMREITVERAKQIAVEYAVECVKAYLEKESKKGCDSLELYNSEYEKLEKAPFTN